MAEDHGGKRTYKQVARRYIESELVSIRKELLERRAESVKLREALSSIAAAEPSTRDSDGWVVFLAHIREVAQQALSEGQ